jgi:hypothetical protein
MKEAGSETSQHNLTTAADDKILDPKIIERSITALFIFLRTKDLH